MKKRIIYYDMLNIAAAFGVVCMHCNGIVHSYSNTSVWKQSLIVEVLAYWAVPIFFMLSGATLLKYQERYDTRIFIKKRIRKNRSSVYNMEYNCVYGSNTKRGIADIGIVIKKSNINVFKLSV